MNMLWRQRLSTGASLAVLLGALLVVPAAWLADGIVHHERLDEIIAAVGLVISLASGATVLGLLRASVHARRRAEVAEQRFRLVFESAGVGISLGQNGVMAETNPAYQRMLGYSSEELARMHYLDVTHPDDRALDLEVSEDVMAGRRPMSTFEKRYITKSGEVRTAQVTVTLAADASFGIAVTEDITDWKELQEQLRDAERMESVGRLAGGVAHDFNNLLTAIGGYAKLLQSEPTEETRVEWLQSIVAASDRAAALTQQLLAFGRRQLLRPQALDLGALLEGLEPMLQSLLPVGATLRLNAEPGLVVTADRHQLEYVVFALVGNACEAIGPAGAVEISARHEGGNAVLTVADDGAGIDAAALGRIFEPFYTTRSAADGRGLGLATVHGVVAQSGGTIEVDSDPGEGAVFTVRLPLEREALSEPVASAPAPALPAKATVLLVEDADMVRQVTTELLRAQGFEVMGAPSGEDGLRLLAARPHAVDVLVSDVVLPGRSGLEVAAAARKIRPGLPVVFVSGYPADALDEVELGDIEILAKPFRAEELAARIEAALASAATLRPAAVATR